jgi:hypothetical protein
MLRSILFCLFILIISCKAKRTWLPLSQVNTLTINCEKEKLLIENPMFNREYSVDSIKSARKYWKMVNHDQGPFDDALYPYVSVNLDTPSLYKSIHIGLVGPRDWKPDGRLKCSFGNGIIDSIRITDFFSDVSKRSDIKTQTDAQLLSHRFKAEVHLYFDNDSIQNISVSLKKIARLYISFQKLNAERLFHTRLCDLDISHADSLKRNVPLRIRLLSFINGR